MTCDILEVVTPAKLVIDIEAAVVAVINIIIAIFGTVANGLIIMAYSRNLRLRTIQNTIFFLLALTDIGVTSFVQPIYVITELKKITCFLWNVHVVSSFLFVALSLVTIIILSLHSYTGCIKKNAIHFLCLIISKVLTLVGQFWTCFKQRSFLFRTSCHSYFFCR